MDKGQTNGTSRVIFETLHITFFYYFYITEECTHLITLGKKQDI